MQRCSDNSRIFSLLAWAVLAASVMAVTLFAADVESSSAAVTSSSRDAVGSQKLTLYADATKKQFINNTDDLARGEGHNPFGNYSTTSITTKANEKLSGPFAGDEGEFEFDLSTRADHKSTAGSAIFICQYNFNQNAFCDAAFQLAGGTLIGKGAFSFNSGTATLAIIGGTFKYRTMKGHVELSALGSATQPQPIFRVVPMLQSQRFTFEIHPA